MREPGYEAKMLLEAIREEAARVERRCEWVLARTLRSLADGFESKVNTSD